MITLLRSLEILFEFLEILIIVRVFMGIFRVNMDNFIGRIIYELTEPILSPAKAILNKLGLDRYDRFLTMDSNYIIKDYI